jgi:8-oxo-dGTP pyrophosphatase MutT (NUDIX family)
MNTRVVASALIELNGKILLGKKGKGVGPYPDAWHFPGGGIKLEEESVGDAVRREVKEETGLDLSQVEKISFEEDFKPNKHNELTHYVFLVFKVKPTSANFTPGDDLVELKWFNINELSSLNIPEPSRKALGKIKL